MLPTPSLPLYEDNFGYYLLRAATWCIRVSFASQTAYVQAAKSHGRDIIQIEMHGGGAEHHGLAKQGRDIAAECMNGLSTADIVVGNQSR